jgi:MFS transporter, MFS domain-containing protein family, molybdate-anion transporter
MIHRILYVGGFLNPFDLAFIALLLCGIFASTTWEENYGTHSESSSITSDDNVRTATNHKCYDGLKNAFTTTIRSTDVCLCGVICSLFEGSMYIFVFMWTPALKISDDDSDPDNRLPHGLIFCTFMVCCMAGSSIFSIFIEKIKGEQFAVAVFAVAATSMMLICISSNSTMKLMAMNLFEITVGMYFPIMGT